MCIRDRIIASRITRKPIRRMLFTPAAEKRRARTAPKIAIAMDALRPVSYTHLGVAHVFSSWTRMPEIGVQMHLPPARTADFTLARALLRRGRAYEDAVAKFTPYSHVQDPNPETRDALRLLIAHARERHQPSYIFVNNRLEGNAPETIEAITDA